MTELQLFDAPTACSDATPIALEHMQVPYTLHLVRFAKGGLLHFGKSEYEDAKVVSDLAWAATGLHPLVTRIFLPSKIVLAGFDLTLFPRYEAHGVRMLAQPAVQRTWAKRTALQDQLKSEGLLRPPAPAAT